MRKWRPTTKCIYVVPEIHGELNSLKIILNRITPFRTSSGQEDILIFLGDYIDKGNFSCEVVSLLLDLKNEYKEKIFFLKGNHEHFLLEAFQNEKNYKKWLFQCSGINTIASYLKYNELNSEPSTFPFSRLNDIIPKQHKMFYQNLLSYLELEKYILFHGGYDLSKNINSIDSKSIPIDIECSKNYENNMHLFSNKIHVGSHNYKNKYPKIYKNYFMLGGTINSLVLFELNSMSCSIIKNNKSRIYKHKFKILDP